jgi:hypothetical protein
MLQIGKMRINLLTRLKIKNKNQSVKLISENKNNHKENSSNNTTRPVPSLTDMEFNWIEDY